MPADCHIRTREIRVARRRASVRQQPTTLAVVAHVSFAKAIQRHTACPPAEIAGDTLRGVLETYFETHPAARTYVLDERGAVRKHVAVFVNETLVLDRERLSDRITPNDRVTVFQALSGGST